MPNFGSELDPDEFILEIMDTFKPTGDYIYDKQVLIEYYETRYGLYDHLKNGKPMASVSYHEGENFRENGLYDSYLRTFLYKDVHKKLGLTFDEYLGRPRSEILSINRIIDEIDKQRNEVNKKAMDEIERPSKKKTTPNLDLSNILEE